MNTRQSNTLDAIKRAYIFVTSTPLPTPLQNPSSGLTAQITGLKAAIDSADAEATNQTSGTVQQALDQRNALRDNLRSAHLEPILHVARVLEKTNPGLPKLVNMRSARTAQGLLNAAQAALRDLPPYKDLFVTQGLPTDFLDQLQTAVAAFQNAGNTVREIKVAKIQSRTGLATALEQGDNCTRIIGAIIRRAAPSDPNGQTFLSGWEAASHLKRDKSSSTGTTTLPATPTTTGTPALSSGTTPSTAIASTHVLVAPTASAATATTTVPASTPAAT
ncbi:MAG TPA: hypothetical protein VNU46_00170 [Gemmatimonadaceae bacterium]|nr:hypothetical protein [Gemmatimonadaceae bacterium]